MRLSEFFPRSFPKESGKTESINHDLLTRGGFIERLMAGSYSFLPLGWRVEQKVEAIIREEMDATGALEVRMPLLHPREIWDETGRWEKADEVMYKLRAGEKDYALSFTHEEILLDVVRKRLNSYRDLPIKLYHFSTKFRQELRPRSGLLRGREFIMKDLYSAHISEQDLDAYYETVSKAYLAAFRRIGFEGVLRVEAGGGVFTDQFTHEFNVLVDSGESKIYHCEKCEFAQNDEVFRGKPGDPCPKCGAQIKLDRGIEIGNIFRFGTDYSEKMGVRFTGEDGREQPVWFGSYGIGASRVVGALVEVFHDEHGIIWPETVAPFRVHLVGLFGSDEKVKKATEKLYSDLSEAGVEVLYDDRDESPGKKFADADLIGCTIRLTVSQKTLENDSVELKMRNESEIELVSGDAVIKRLTKR